MSLRQQNLGSIIKPGFNPLVAPSVATYNYNLFTWGSGATYGQLGLGNTSKYSSPKQVGSLANWNGSVEAGFYHCLVVKTDGTLWTWGWNDYGQLGLGNNTRYSSPKQVGALTNWSQAVGGYYHSVAIKTDGTLWSWGNGGGGKLGLLNTTSYSSPKQVGALTNWLRLSAGYQFTVALKTDGTMWSWGQNNNGCLGHNNLTNYSSPKQIGALNTWAYVSKSIEQAWHVLAVKTDGTLWCWGYNNNGQLGLGNKTDYSSPKQLGALSNWLKVTCGYGSSFSTKTDGTLWSWGYNGSGQLGLGTSGTYTEKSSPNQIGVLTNWSKIAVGSQFVLAIKTDGTLWSWGDNSEGQLGNGNTTSRSSPAQIGASALWSTPACGYSNAMVTG